MILNAFPTVKTRRTLMAESVGSGVSSDEARLCPECCLATIPGVARYGMGGRRTYHGGYWSARRVELMRGCWFGSGQGTT